MIVNTNILGIITLVPTFMCTWLITFEWISYQGFVLGENYFLLCHKSDKVPLTDIYVILKAVKTPDFYMTS